MSPCGTYDDNQRTREDKATQPLDVGRLSLAIYDLVIFSDFSQPHFHWCLQVNFFKQNSFPAGYDAAKHQGEQLLCPEA